MTAPGLLLLDTSVLLHLLRGTAVGRSMDEAYALSTREERPLISIVTVGEVMAIARRTGATLLTNDKDFLPLEGEVEVLVVPDRS
jgi:predicted nucleic acid-binding protein